MTLENWIMANTKIRAHINWENEQAERLNYENWTPQMKADLENVFDLIKNYEWIMVPDPPPNELELDEDDWPSTYLSPQNAWDIYVAHIAQSLAVQIKHWVSWSLNDFDDDDLRELLDSRFFFRPLAMPSGEIGYKIDYRSVGNSTPGTPSLPWVLMKHGGLIAETQVETIANLVEWCREHLRHYGSLKKDHYTLNHDAHWHYRGYVPVSRVLLSTKKEYDNDELHIHVHDSEKHHWTAGCHGTVGFLRNMLRTVNIPVLYERYGGHGQPYFPTVEKWLSHGDDPYNQNVRAAGYPSDYILMDDADYDATYPDQDADEVNQNSQLVGMHVKRLTIKWLPLSILHDRISDVKTNKSKENSEVWGNFVSWEGLSAFTIADLEAERLWERLDQKIEAYGGPEKVPAVGEEDYLWDSWKQVLRLKQMREQNALREKRRKDLKRTKRKLPDMSGIQKIKPEINPLITQLAQSSQAGSKKPATKRKRPAIKKPIPPKKKPLRKPRARKKPVKGRKPIPKKKKPTTDRKKPAVKKKTPKTDKKKPAPDKKKRSIRKRVSRFFRRKPRSQ